QQNPSPFNLPVSGGSGMSRRQFIAAMPVVALPACTPAFAEPISPVRAKFEEWRRVFTWVNEGGLDDDEVEKRTDALGQAERAVFSEPAQDAGDVLWKI